MVIFIQITVTLDKRMLNDADQSVRDSIYILHISWRSQDGEAFPLTTNFRKSHSTLEPQTLYCKDHNQRIPEIGLQPNL